MNMVELIMNLNSFSSLILFALHSVFTVLGLLLLKISVSELEKTSISSLLDLLTIKFFLGLVLYTLAFVLSLVILNKFPLGMSVSIMMPLSLVSATIVGFVFLNENVTFLSVFGLILILIGIFTIYIEKQ